jgi:hypothetical protein
MLFRSDPFPFSGEWSVMGSHDIEGKPERAREREVKESI